MKLQPGEQLVSMSILTPQLAQRVAAAAQAHAQSASTAGNHDTGDDAQATVQGDVHEVDAQPAASQSTSTAGNGVVENEASLLFVTKKGLGEWVTS